jgi:phosphopantothenoylcysteine decarboxylase/phosphopantothenate--cysteine ligase
VVLDGLEGISLIQVQSSEEMYLACKDSFKEVDVCVMAAAVADYKPSQVGKQKLKKKEESIHLELTKTTDILASLGKEKSTKQLLIGFALETENGVDNAKEKMLRKNCDIMLLNSPEKGRTGFGSDTNQLTVINNNKVEAWSLMTKQKLADKIVRELILDHFKK